jgi:hypothetical protein
MITKSQIADDGYYLIEANKIFRVCAYSLLNGAPDIPTNLLLGAICYVIQFHKFLVFVELCEFDWWNNCIIG